MPLFYLYMKDLYESSNAPIYLRNKWIAILNMGHQDMLKRDELKLKKRGFTRNKMFDIL